MNATCITAGHPYADATTVRATLDFRTPPRSDYLRAMSNRLADVVADAMESGCDDAEYRFPAECADIFAEYATFYDSVLRALPGGGEPAP